MMFDLHLSIIETHVHRVGYPLRFWRYLCGCATASNLECTDMQYSRMSLCGYHRNQLP